MQLKESTFIIFAAKHYDNPHCHDLTEFEEDLKRFLYLRKLLVKYKSAGELKERLILNHLIIIYNCFGLAATNMLFMKLEGFHEFLKPFVLYLNYLPETISYSDKIINTSKISSDLIITNKLKDI